MQEQNRRLNLDLEKSIFIKNDDETYTVYQIIGKNFITLPCVDIHFEAVALPDKNGEKIKISSLEKDRMITRIFRKIFGRTKGKNYAEQKGKRSREKRSD